MSRLLVYGASGYTGRMAAAHAKSLGLDVVLAGRGGPALRDLARALGVAYREFSLEDQGTVGRGLDRITAVLNCAGPFMRTAGPLMRAAVQTGVHYLDVAAELDSYRLAEALDADATHAGVMLLPGSGGSVAMLGCLAEHARKRVDDPKQLRIALQVSGSMSRGSAISASENMSGHCVARVAGNLEPRNPQDIEDFDFGEGPRPCFPVTLPDLITIWRATQIPDIGTFVHISEGSFPSGDLSAMSDGPSAEERAANRYRASAVVVGADGASAHSVLDTVNGYTFTPMAAAEAARRVLAGETAAGFQVPAVLFGGGFAETIADTRIMDFRIR